MLSRRHIRLKVMQSLYSYFSTKEDNMPIAEHAMLKHIEEVVELNLVIIALLIELVKYADNFYEDSKKKHFPSAEDLLIVLNVTFVIPYLQQFPSVAG